MLLLVDRLVALVNRELAIGNREGEDALGRLVRYAPFLASIPESVETLHDMSLSVECGS